MKDAIPILSLAIAVLAVFVGPMLSWRTACHQTATALAVAAREITDPMRQAWINTLRDLTAELDSRALHYYVAGFEDRSDAEYQQLSLLEHKIALMLNPTETDHQQFEQSIRKMISSLESGKNAAVAFPDAHKQTRAMARAIFKREWNRVKEPIKAA